MEKANALFWEVSWWEFLLVTAILAGGAAYLTGRAVARAWQSNLQLVYYIILLAAATRFIHFALFRGTLLSLHYYVVDFGVLLVIAFLGNRITRARQMATQYSFLYARAGLLGWKARG
ncbi:hypothetical protein NYR54_00700 [Chelativorans sp. SCAU2101]|jgi:GR25 family glycosyltransferase involved in LPS biosynthesis|uniref:DUF6867 domain-containing protein n=1 Tax=Chelativorans petroleitrophicus TaxID=2975484 RepID=A0A9X2X6U6_9HYPH|nr:hypothetical protein [Chelativorans petroleitrophicus]MCT8988817.1 hypothetical protein [Chelativorans petroleitrophicus]